MVILPPGTPNNVSHADLSNLSRLPTFHRFWAPNLRKDLETGGEFFSGSGSSGTLGIPFVVIEIGATFGLQDSRTFRRFVNDGEISPHFSRWFCC